MPRFSEIWDVSGIAESMFDYEIPSDLEKVLDAWKELAEALKYTGPVAWHVKGGFSFQTDFPVMVQPHNRTLRLMQKWSLKNPEPTQPAIVFWIPRAFNTYGGIRLPRRQLVDGLREQYGLPSHHLVDFGSAFLVSALLRCALKEGHLSLDHFRYLHLGFPTDTMTDTGFRVFIRCGPYHKRYFECLRFDDDGSFDFFPIGIELGRSPSEY